MIGFTVRVLCANVHSIALKLRTVLPKDKNVKRVRNGLWTDTNTTFGSKVTCRNLWIDDMIHG